LAPDDAVTLLRRVAQQNVPELAEIAHRLSYLPLGLQLAGHRIREAMTAQEWLSRHRESVSALRVTQFKGPYKSLAACFQVSVDALEDQENLPLLYHSLGIFPEGLWVPRSIVLRLWQQLKSPWNAEELDDQIRDLAELGLVQLRGPAVGMHDLLHDYNRYQLQQKDLLTEHQRFFLATYNPEYKRPWYEVKHDGYLYHHLVHHMVEADEEAKLVPLLRSTVRWLERTCDRPDVARERLVVDIWKYYWDWTFLYFPLNDWAEGANCGRIGHPTLSRGEPNVPNGL
jgi:hypothetical protein